MLVQSTELLVRSKKAMNHEPITHNSSGFTLVELLIAILIILMITVVAIPNVKKYGQDQQIEEAASNVISALKQAHSGFTSGIQCSNGTASNEWDLILSTSNYSLTASCNGGGSDTRIPSTPYSPNTAIQMIPPSSCGLTNLISKIKFTKTISSDCVTGNPSAPIYFILKNTSNNQCRKITVGLGGVINKENICT